MPAQSKVDYDQITSWRLARWADELSAQNSTPFILVGIGHERTNGQLIVCVPENLADDEVIGLIRSTLRMLEARRGR